MLERSDASIAATLPKILRQEMGWDQPSFHP